MEKRAQIDHDVLDVIARRWSPRAFSSRPIEPEKIKRLFEAARWAASSYNEQPWRFIAATKDQPEAYQRILSCLVPTNQAWAKSAPLLILTLAKRTFSRNGNPNRVHIHDIGLAMGNLSIQATAMDLALHQMAGVELDKVREVFKVPDEFEPVTAAAVGYVGTPDQLPEAWMQEAETSERTRKPLGEIVFTEAFDQPSPLV